VTCTIDPEAGLVYTTVRDAVSIDDIIQKLETVIRHPDSVRA